MSGAAKASCIWSSPSLQTVAMCSERTALRSRPSPRSSPTTRRTSCQSEELSTCPCCIPSQCRPSDSDIQMLIFLVLLNIFLYIHIYILIIYAFLPVSYVLQHCHSTCTAYKRFDCLGPSLIPASTLTAYKRARCLRNLWNSTSLKSLYFNAMGSWNSAIIDGKIGSWVLPCHRGKRQNLVLRWQNLCNLAWSFVFIAVRCDTDLKNIIGGVRVALACANNPGFFVFFFLYQSQVIGGLVWGLKLGVEVWKCSWKSAVTVNSLVVIFFKC